MNGKDDLRKIVDDFLVDDGFDRDIVLLANQMGIDVGYDYFSEISSSNEYEFIAFIYIGDDRKVISINGNYGNNAVLSRFVVAYLLASYVNSDKINYKSLFRIEEMDINNYMLAKKIIDRRNKYKKNRKEHKLLKIFKDN